MHQPRDRSPDRRGGGRGSRARAALPLLLSLIGCEGEDLTATAGLELRPERLDFGAVTFGESRTLELRIANPSAVGTLRLESIALAGGSAPAFELGEAPEVLAPGADVIVAVRYTPDDAEPDAGTIVLRTNAAGQPIRRVPLSSARTFPKLALRPDRVELGSVLSGGRAEASLEVRSVGDAPLTVSRIALRTAGFFGEPCTSDAQCRSGACAPGRQGGVCASPCEDGCPAGATCADLPDQSSACLPDASPALTGRGFELRHPDLPAPPPIPPGAALTLDVVYAPGPDDRGSAQVLVETDDADQPVRVVPLLGRPEDLPPTAVAARIDTFEDPVLPGTRIEVSGAGSSDPEGAPLAYAWRFLTRPQGSRAAFEAPDAVETAFTVDRPGLYVATLEVVDEAGQASSNDARVEVSTEAGPGFEVELTWDRPGTDLDLHVVAPGGSLGSVDDCFFDNPSPDWAPAGPEGDPRFEAGPAREVVAVTEPPSGAFTIAARVVAASLQGPAAATLRIRYAGVEVARYAATLEPAHTAWDVATLSWPDGRIADLDTIR